MKCALRLPHGRSCTYTTVASEPGRASYDLALREEQRDYVLGITSLWMLTPAAHALTGLVSAGLPPLELLASPELLSTAQSEQLRRAAALTVLLPTCVVSLVAWRWSDAPAYAALDRACARSFFVALVATNLLVPDYSLAMWMPAGLLLLYMPSAASEHMGFPRSRLWTHAAFRCGGFWWAYASCCSGLESIQPWYFALSMAVYWGHIAWSCHWSAQAAPPFHRAPHYAAGCATVAVFAAAATLGSPALQWPQDWGSLFSAGQLSLFRLR